MMCKLQIPFIAKMNPKKIIFVHYQRFIFINSSYIFDKKLHKIFQGQNSVIDSIYIWPPKFNAKNIIDK
jgi:hypothetical protein